MPWEASDVDGVEKLNRKVDSCFFLQQIGVVVSCCILWPDALCRSFFNRLLPCRLDGNVDAFCRSMGGVFFRSS